MRLSPRDREMLLVHVAADLAKRRRADGLQLNYPEAMAIITSYVLEEARAARRWRGRIRCARSRPARGTCALQKRTT